MSLLLMPVLAHHEVERVHAYSLNLMKILPSYRPLLPPSNALPKIEAIIAEADRVLT